MSEKRLWMLLLAALILTTGIPFAAGGPNVGANALARLSTESALVGSVSFSFVDTPITDVMSAFKERFKINVIIDPQVLQGNERLVTMTVSNVSGKQALTLALKLAGLTYVTRDGILFVTTPQGVWQYQETELRIYDVRDFLAVPSGGFNTLTAPSPGGINVGNPFNTSPGPTAPMVPVGAPNPRPSQNVWGAMSVPTASPNQGVWGQPQQTQTTPGQGNAGILSALMSLIVQITGPENWGTATVLGSAAQGSQVAVAGGSF